MTDMKKTVLMIAAAAAVLSCTQENTSLQPQTTAFNENQFGATASENTKVSIDENWSLSWEENDLVNINDGENTVEFHALSAGKSTVLEAEDFHVDRTRQYYAVYPASADNGFSDGCVTLSVPALQTAVPGEYPECAAVSSASGSEQNFVFKNVCGLVSFEITEPDVTRVILFGGNGEDICGTVNVNCSDASYTVTNGSKTVRLYNSDDSAIAQGRYYIAILPGSYTQGMSLSVSKADGTRVRRNCKAFEMARSMYVDLEQLDKDRNWKTEYTIKNSEELMAFLSVASRCTPQTIVSLDCDIDMTDVRGIAEGFAGTFDGCGHRLLNFNNASIGLFRTLTGTVRNLIIDESCSMELHSDIDAQAMLVRYNEGLIENVTNYASLSNTEPLAQTKTFNFGFIAGICQNGGCMKDCINHGSAVLTLAPEQETKNPAIGGIAGAYDSLAEGYVFDGCTNYGDISLTSDGKKFRTYIGGICGKSGSGTRDNMTCRGSINGCHNHGDISYITTENVGPEASHSNIGGVIGYQEGNLYGCTNSGNVLFSAKNSSTDATHVRPAVGGVAGCAVYNVHDCKNTGNVTVSGTFKAVSNLDGTGTSLNCAFGGIAGMAGPETPDKNVTISGCINSGAVSLDISMPSDQSLPAFAGGVAGFVNVPAENCTNSGALTVKSTYQRSVAGGVFGACACSVTDCDNQADILFDYAISAAEGNRSQFGIIGGVIGYAGPDAVEIGLCDNRGAMIKAINGHYNNSGAYIGGVLGFAASDLNASNPDKATNLTECTNGAGIISSTSSRWRMGGVAGGTQGTLSHCSSTGSFDITGITDWSMIGGIVGYSTVKDGVSGCEYRGGISVSGGGSNTYVGGLVARLDGSNENMLVTGTVGTVISAVNCIAGFAAGWLNGTKQVNLGSNSAGKLNVYSGTSVNGTAITADNCKEKSTGYAFGKIGFTDTNKIYNGNTVFIDE